MSNAPATLTVTMRPDPVGRRGRAPRGLSFGLTVGLGLGPTACQTKTNSADVPAPRVQHEQSPAPDLRAPGDHVAYPGRIVAMGDVHGDLQAAQKALRLAGLIDAQGNWSGGDTVLVQTGDVLDRGDDEPEILSLLWRLAEQAPKVGGRVELLLGNHEIMNASGDLRYVTPGGFEDYKDTEVPPNWPQLEADAQGPSRGYLGRRAAFAPGSQIAKRFAEHKIAVVVGDSVFVHGGLSPAASQLGIDTMNQQTRTWLLGRGPLPEVLQNPDGPIWNRDYGRFPDAYACEQLANSLKELGVRRMVVGHTVQERGITSACNGQVWRIDVGMARHYGGTAQALEIRGDAVRVLR